MRSLFFEVGSGCMMGLKQCCSQQRGGKQTYAWRKQNGISAYESRAYELIPSQALPCSRGQYKH